MQIRFLLGPAGSGKTFRCLNEIGERLAGSPEGPALLFLAPKQTTYQLERQLLAGSAIRGYTRLHILSFERLAHLVFERLGKPAPQLLDEEGRVMVLRALLARKRKDLQLFRASARLTGFAHQLSNVLSELQRSQLTPESLDQLAAKVAEHESLSLKLRDLAALLAEYVGWLKAHQLQDADCLLPNATQLLEQRATGTTASALGITEVWVDGFAEFSAQELELLAALLPACERATLTYCLDELSSSKLSWLSSWSVTRQSFECCHKRLAAVPGARLSVECLPRDSRKTRFLQNPILRHLEAHWALPQPFASAAEEVGQWQDSALLTDKPADRQLKTMPASLADSLRVLVCSDPVAEVTIAAREIAAYVRQGGRYKEVTVLVRKLETYHQELQRVFSRYEIPSFLDRRESMAHHPLAELTRSALRTVALGWQHEDWFAALKTGMVPAPDDAVDRLENEALARGWRGAAWQEPLAFHDSTRGADEEKQLRRLEAELEALRAAIVPPFQKLALAFRLAENKPTGPQLADALRNFWDTLNVRAQLESWLGPEGSGRADPGAGSMHETVWSQMNLWLENVELAFADEALAVRDWLPILEAGLANLTVGVIPPALDQVLIGAVDRSRNPDIKFALLLGMNETLFPAPPDTGGLLSENDRLELEKHNALLTCSARQQLSRERHYAYIACTRARQRIVLTCAERDLSGKPLNPSAFLDHLRLLFPTLEFETAPKAPDWQHCQHVTDLIETVLRDEERASDSPGAIALWAPFLAARTLVDVPGIASVLDRLRALQVPASDQTLAPGLAAQLYGPALRTSVSRLEQFAACPFKFFVHSGLRAEERKRFELDSREQGTFQHDVLALFHEQLRDEKKRWRDIPPAEARQRVARIANTLMASYRDGLLQANEQTRFMARFLTQSLQDFVETLVGWMRRQYEFDPVAVELPFGEDESSPAWEIDPGDGHRLELRGRVDRVDLLRKPGNDEALCVVVDYKSSHKQLDPVLMGHGLQLQLLAYLGALRHWPNPARSFGVARLIPAGVFYVNLRGKTSYEANRLEALKDAEQGRKLAYRHSGRFDVQVLPHLDSRLDVQKGDQFNYRRTQAGKVHASCREPVPSREFIAMLDHVEDSLRAMGRQIYAGVAEVSPYRKGALTACDRCEYQAICRIDPSTHRFRVLRKEPKSMD